MRFHQENVTLPVTVNSVGDYEDWGFAQAKGRYLAKKYPLDRLPIDGCIEKIFWNVITYRRVDLARGLAADMIYLKGLGVEVVTAFTPLLKLHGTSMSPLIPRIIKLGLYPDDVPAQLQRTLFREVRARYRQNHGANHSTTRRMDAWAHRLNTAEDFERALERLDEK
jgi:hypothetical protein